MTIFGWDLSHFDSPDIGNAVSQGISFMTHKAGGDANDPEIAAWWSKVKGLDPSKVLLGAYWVLYPGSPVTRADAFLARLDATCPGWRDRPFLLQADCEKWNGDAATVPSVADINAFCDRLVAKMPKLRPVGYLPDWVYGTISAFKYPLWSSKYVTSSGPFKSIYPGDNAKQWASYGGKTPSILQYADKATIGGQTTCDANAYRGTLAELISLCAPGWQEEDDMPLTTDDINRVATATAAATKAALTTTTNFTDAAGGAHNPISDAVWNSQQIPGPDGKRGYAWPIMSGLTGGMPTAEEIAEQVVDQLGGQNAADIAATLKSVLPADLLAEVVAALQAA